jgi:hypothetical protein
MHSHRKTPDQLELPTTQCEHDYDHRCANHCPTGLQPDRLRGAQRRARHVHQRAWRELGPGERISVPAGAPHTIRNMHHEKMRALNVHSPALDFPDYMAGLHELVHSGKVRALPLKDPRSVIYIDQTGSHAPDMLAS